MIGYMEVIMDDSYLHTSLNTAKLHLLFDNYNSILNSNVWLSKAKLDDRTKLSNHYSELMSGWLEGQGFTEDKSDAELESLASQWKEGTKFTMNVDLDEHLSYLDQFKAKYSI